MSPAIFRLLLTLVVAAATTATHAGVYKCKVDGKWVYSDQKCAADSAPINANPNVNRARSSGAGRDTYYYSGRAYRNPPGRTTSDDTAVITSGDTMAKARCEALKRWKAEADAYGSYRGKTPAELEDMDFSLCYGRVNKAQ
ncbi:MAG: hypothetical protein KDH20_09080 [Rhodocyclaceae bacterium]|nr:hypothetical protein [Rhodocyclaceae bacterium]